MQAIELTGNEISLEQIMNVARQGAQYTKNAADKQIPTAYKKTLKLKY